MPDTEFVKLLHNLAAVFGPVGAVAILMSGVIAYFYRRDFLLERKRARAMHERAEAREDRAVDLVKENATTNERLSQTIGRLADSIERAEENRQRHLDTMTQFLASRRE